MILILNYMIPLSGTVVNSFLKKFADLLRIFGLERQRRVATKLGAGNAGWIGGAVQRAGGLYSTDA